MDSRARIAFGLTPLLWVLLVWPCFGQVDSRHDGFLEELQRATFRYFWETADPMTGLVKDRSKADGKDNREIASIAATGFGLSALCLGHEQKFIPQSDALARTLATLRFIDTGLPHEHGFFYHFINMRTGERAWKCELSSIDTAILLCGVLTAQAYFQDKEVSRLAKRIYERVEWPWMLDADGILRHGWKPESGFLQARWDEYSELMMLYLLALGSPTHPIPAESWERWRRPRITYKDFSYISPRAPLFVHQFSHAWFDFRKVKDRYTNYFQNSVVATKAHRQFCLDLRDRFPHFNETCWGITSSDSARGYRAWGGPPEHGNLDGTVVPCAAGGSMAFLPDECIAALRGMKDRYGEKIWNRYGFVDAFNPQTAWTGPDVIGIDAGITLLMVENARREFFWRLFMQNESVRKAMKLAGFVPEQ